MIQGRAIKFGSNIDTDQIIGAHHLILPDICAMAPYTFEHHPQFSTHFCRGDILVGEENFGCGSSREQAPAVLQERGVAAIIACNFARIFFRNATNLGLRLITCSAAPQIMQMEILEIDTGRLINRSSGKEYAIEPLPHFLQEILESGGIISHLQKKA